MYYEKDIERIPGNSTTYDYHKSIQIVIKINNFLINYNQIDNSIINLKFFKDYKKLELSAYMLITKNLKVKIKKNLIKKELLVDYNSLCKM